MFVQLLVICLCLGWSQSILVDNGPPACVDVAKDCRYYQSEMCTAKDFRPWAESHCAKFCGFCTPGKPAGTTPRDCTDKVTCVWYDRDGSLCANDSFRFWIEDNCRSYCHVLGC